MNIQEFANAVRTDRRNAMRSWIDGHEVELLLSLRMTLAALITFGLAKLFGFQQGYWGVLTVVIVMQSSVGASLKATFERVIGTLGGAVWAVVASALVDRGGSSPEIVVLLVALAPLALVAALRPAYRVAPITAIIVLLSSAGEIGGLLATGFHRVADILLGCVVALAVSLFVWPSRARKLLVQSVAGALESMASELERIGEGSFVGAPGDPTRSAVVRAAALADEVKRERRNHLTDAPDPDPILRAVRRVRHDLESIGRAYEHQLPEPIHARLGEPSSRAAYAVGEVLHGIAAALTGEASYPSLDGALAALSDLAASVERIRQDGVSRSATVEQAGRMFGIAHAFEHLRTDLKDLENRAREFDTRRA